MKKIKLGADELILWLRKNEKAVSVPNDGAHGLGRRIYDLIISLGGDKIANDKPSYWESEDNSKNIGRFALPKTSDQYEIDVKLLSKIYESLCEW